jgi:iron uptake system EfeUOB component EfeO/EfeM
MEPRHVLVACACAVATSAVVPGCGSGTSRIATTKAAHAYTKALAAADRRPPRTPAEAPVPVKAFHEPIAQYRRYALAQVASLSRDVATLTIALQSGDRTASQAAWRVAFARYLRLGAVYGEFATLDQAIDGTPGPLPGGVDDPHFTGLHRIEYGLWGAQDPTELVPVAQRLAADVVRLHTVIPKVSFPTLDYATRAHEILEDAQRDFLSGTDVPWSGEGVLATASGVAATDEIVQTLSPLLDGDLLVTLQTDDMTVHQTLDMLRRANGGTLPTLAELSMRQREQLDAAVGALLEQLQEIPGELETVPAPPTPRLKS